MKEEEEAKRPSFAEELPFFEELPLASEQVVQDQACGCSDGCGCTASATSEQLQVVQEAESCTDGCCSPKTTHAGADSFEQLIMSDDMQAPSQTSSCCSAGDSCCSSSSASIGGFEELLMLTDAPASPQTPPPHIELQPGEARSVFQVDGMDCGECARTVERVVRKMEGVREVQVNFNTTKMTVIHSAATAEIPSMMKAVDQVGYRTALLETTLEAPGVTLQANSGASSPWEKHKRTILTVISGIFTAAGLIAEHTGFPLSTAIFLYAIAIVTGGFYAARSGYYALKSKTLDMNFLMTAAAIGAAAIGQWSEGAAVVFLFSVGNWLQSLTMERTRRSIRSLIELTPQEALVRRGTVEQVLPLTDVRIGDTVIVRPGERLPMDGVVTTGRSTVDQAPVTGESIPVLKQAGDDVFAGTINESGALEFRVTKRVEDSTIARMIHLIEEAQSQKAPSQQFVDVFANYYTPIVVLLAVLIALLPPLIAGASFHTWIYRALVLLVIACPCALVISTPVSIVAAIGNAAKRGVLIKGGAFLEAMGAIRAIAFDKTGTLTAGRPQVVAVEPFANVTAADMLSIAAALESRSEHPLARAITEAYATTGQAVQTVTDFQALAGQGATGVVGGINYSIGKPAWIAEIMYNDGSLTKKTLPHETVNASIQTHLQQGRTVMLLTDQSEVLGLIAVADVVREETAETIRRLRSVGIAHTAMLTGDHELTARAIQAQVGVDEYAGELLPEQKLERIRDLKKRFGRVAMVGDGINDAPALASADIGIAMGGAGTDTALETADIVLMSDDLGKLPFTVRLSRRALAVIKQNIWFSLLVKVVFLALTMLGLANLWMAVFADTGAALIVIANGMRLMQSKHS